MASDNDDHWGAGLQQRIDDYLKTRKEGTVGLPQVLAALGADLRAASEHAVAEGHPMLALKDASVEIDVAMTYEANATAKIKFWVFTEASIEGDVKRERDIKITVNLTPLLDPKNPVPIAIADAIAELGT